MRGCQNVGKDQVDGLKRLVLVGNPNVGKSVVFNYLTGSYVDVSNFPGTTVDVSQGKYKNYIVLDTPGIYGVSSFNDEEKVARDVILDADLLLNVVDGVHLERDLFLTLQLADMGIPMVVAINMMDEVKRQGIEIDFKALEKYLGVPIVPICATEQKDLEKLVAALPQATVGKKGKEVDNLLKEYASLNNLTEAQILLALEGDLSFEGIPEKREELYFDRRKRVDDLCKKVVRYQKTGTHFSEHLGDLLLKPALGIPVLFLVLFLAYKLIGVFAAGTVVDFLEGIMTTYYEPWIRNTLGAVIPLDSIIGQLLLGEFGILTMTVTYIFGLLLPLVIAFYLLLSILEDSGYLPRVAALLDRSFNKVGLNGRAVIPMVLGFGCVTMASISTRILGSDRERLIAIILLSLTIPCSAQMGVITAMLSSLGFGYFLAYVVIMIAIFVIAGTLLNKILPGQPTDLLIDIPPMRLPLAKNVLQKTWNKSVHFITEAGPLFAIGALLITVLQMTGALDVIQTAAAPLVVNWMKLPKEASTAFMMGIIRRDFGAAGFFNMTLTKEQTLVAMTTLTLFVPCIASIVVIIKERGFKQGLAVFLSCMLAAFLVGGTMAQILI
ncbi:MAG TPA: ferrous iron transport protein B [Firmicutes bacterium]|nr:ferrous iron transport protein B [Bacillota bacterium]